MAGSGRTNEDIVSLGVEFLACFDESIDLPTAVDHLEELTTNPRHTKLILEAAEEQGVIEREDGTVHPNPHSTGIGGVFSFEPETTVKKGDYTCIRCGKSLSEGHFLNLPSGEHGPFGSTCINKTLSGT